MIYALASEEDFAKEGNYRLYDILWSDGKASQSIRPVSDGVVPIGLCVIPTNWLDEGEKARFMALKYMYDDKEVPPYPGKPVYPDPEPSVAPSESPYSISEISMKSYSNDYVSEPPGEQTTQNGSLTSTLFRWGNSYGIGSPIPQDNPEDDPLIPYYVQYTCKDESDGSLKDLEWVAGYNYKTKGNDFKDLRIYKNWLYTLNYCKENPGKYAIGDIDGKQNTINISVEGNYNDGFGEQTGTWYYADMKPLVAQYAPPGTQAGDWYIPALGELLFYGFRHINDGQNDPSINNKLAEISKVYPKDCVKEFDWGYVWSSTVYDNSNAFVIEREPNSFVVYGYSRNSYCEVVPFLQR